MIAIGKDWLERPIMKNLTAVGILVTLTLLANEDGRVEMTKQELAAALNISYSSVFKYLSTLEEQSLITIVSRKYANTTSIQLSDWRETL